jgi:hypothetical protein
LGLSRPDMLFPDGSYHWHRRERDIDLIINALDDFLSPSKCQIKTLILSNLPFSTLLRILDLSAIGSITDLRVSARLSSIMPAEVSHLNSALVDRSTGYRFSHLWIRLSRRFDWSIGTLSVSSVLSLRDAPMWRTNTNRPARIHYELPYGAKGENGRFLRFYTPVACPGYICGQSTLLTTPPH